MESRMEMDIEGMKINVGNIERWISAAAGGALLYLGLRRRSWQGSLMALGGGNLLLRGALGKSLLYRALGINTATLKSAAGALRTIHVERSTSVERPRDEVYRFWRNFENLPRIMGHLKSVRAIDDRTSHWVAKGPAGMEVEWDAEIVDEQENARIAWRSLEGSEVRTWGTVSFDTTPDGRGTSLRVSLDYQPPAGKLGAAMAKLFGEEPDQQIADDLGRFKRMLESGEMAAGPMARG